MKNKDKFFLDIKRKQVNNCINKIISEVNAEANSTKIIFHTSQLIKLINDFFNQLDKTEAANNIEEVFELLDEEGVDK